jgi:hypothetical protein
MQHGGGYADVLQAEEVLQGCGQSSQLQRLRQRAD